MDKLLDNLKNVEEEIIKICINKLTNTNRYCFFIEDETPTWNTINDKMLIKYPFNEELIQKYLTYKDYYSPYDIDVLNLILKDIQIQSNICLRKYKEIGKIVTSEPELIIFINTNPIRNKDEYDKLVRYVTNTSKDILINIFSLIDYYYKINIIDVIKRYGF